MNNISNSNNNNNSSFVVENFTSNSYLSKESIRKRDRETYYDLKHIIDSGVDVSRVVIEDDPAKNTYLMYTSYQGLVNSLRLLLSVPKIDLDAKNNNGKTAFDLAYNEEIKKLLLDAKKGIFPTVLRKGQQMR